MKKKTRAKKFIKMLSSAFSENRSDVSDICNEFLDTWEVPETITPENRFIKAHIPNTKIYVEYDTLTTEIAYLNCETMSTWEQCESHVYRE